MSRHVGRVYGGHSVYDIVCIQAELEHQLASAHLLKKQLLGIQNSLIEGVYICVCVLPGLIECVYRV